MNTGIQDAFNLGWKLAGVIRGKYQPLVLESYNQERHPVAEGLIKGTDLAYKGILHPSEVKQRAVRLLGPFVMRTDTAQNFMRNTLEELTIAYPHSLLTEDHGGSTGPGPGERFLDAQVVLNSDKRTVRLSELSRGVDWMLLLFTGTHERPHGDVFSKLIDQTSDHCAGLVAAHVIDSSQADGAEYAPGTSVLVDALHDAHAKFGVSAPVIYLIRPDNYIGYRGPLHTGNELLAYCKRVFNPRQPK